VVVRSIPELQTDQLIERRNYELVTEYLNSLVEDAQIAQVTVTRYRFYLRHLLLWAWDIPFAKVSTIRPTLIAYLDQPSPSSSRPLALETCKKIIELARKFFEWAKMNHPAEFKPLSPSWIQKLKFLRKHSSHTETEPLFVALDEAISLATSES
jgi:site-specific recombinase XerD